MPNLLDLLCTNVLLAPPPAYAVLGVCTDAPGRCVDRLRRMNHAVVSLADFDAQLEALVPGCLPALQAEPLRCLWLRQQVYELNAQPGRVVAVVGLESDSEIECIEGFGNGSRVVHIQLGAMSPPATAGLRRVLPTTDLSASPVVDEDLADVLGALMANTFGIYDLDDLDDLEAPVAGRAT